MTFLGVSQQQELCGSLNGRTIYLQLGEHGNIIHRNQTTLESTALRCGVELVTCPSCSIQISINRLDLPQMCVINTSFPVNQSMEHCPCGGLTLWEPTGHQEPTHICSRTGRMTFTSSTRAVGIAFDYIPQNLTGSFYINFIAQRNQDFGNGVIGQQGFINSPNFPSLYPRDFGIEHILSCMSEDCAISLLFTDFLISPSSIMEFYDWDGKPLQLVSGLLSRPPVIVSTGSSMIIRFFGNGGTSMGYKAVYKFIQNSTQDSTALHTECGGEVDSLGGTIFMSGLTGYYDCIWTIQPASSISHFKTHIYLKVLEYPENGECVLRSGLTSESRTIEVFSEERKQPTEHVTSLSKGFYISFKGYLSPSSKLVMAYSAFSYVDCLSGIDLLCRNKRCISIQLMCNSIDNCGDNSDESEECKQGDMTEDVRQYWWPLRGRGTGVGGGAAGALLAAGAALLGAVALLGAALCRVALRSRPSNPAHIDHARTIAHLLNIGDLDDRDEPPLYEPPPEYSQVVKSARPRRKQSAQRLIDKDSSSQIHSEVDEPVIPSGSLSEEVKKQPEELTPMHQASEHFNSVVLRRISDSSPPASLETTGYNEQDLGLSMTLSTTSQKGKSISQPPWMHATSSKLISGVTTPSNLSAVSFDTLRSSQDNTVFNKIPGLVKSHSQDNMLNIYAGNTNSFHGASCINISPYSFECGETSETVLPERADDEPASNGTGSFDSSSSAEPRIDASVSNGNTSRLCAFYSNNMASQ